MVVSVERILGTGVGGGGTKAGDLHCGAGEAGGWVK